MQHNEAILETSEILGRGNDKVRDVVKEFETSRTIKTPSKSKRKIRACSALSEGNVASLHEFIAEQNKTFGGVTLKSMQRFLLDKEEVEIKKSTLKDLLKILGYKWGRSKRGTLNTVERAQKALERTRAFLVAMSQAQVLERSGKYVVVFMDESYCNTNHAKGFTWYNPETGNQVGIPSGKGKRVVIVHAMTKDGVLSDQTTESSAEISFSFEVGADGLLTGFGAKSTEPVQAPSTEGKKAREKMKEAPTAEWLWEALKAFGDYHKNMDAEGFMNWVRFRLLPAFDAKYNKGVTDPAKKVRMILVLDNASYHWGRTDEYINPNSKDKTNLRWKLVEFCQKNGITKFSAVRKGKTVQFAQSKVTRSVRFKSRLHKPPITRVLFTGKWKGFGARGNSRVESGPFYPTRDELWAYVLQWAQKNKPDLFHTELQKELAKEGHLLIFTPPYCPQFQPIELLWGFVKGKAAELWKPRRNISQLIRDLKKGFYGCDAFLGATPSRCRGWINKCYRAMAKAAGADPELKETAEFCGIYTLGLSKAQARERATVKLISQGTRVSTLSAKPAMKLTQSPVPRAHAQEEEKKEEIQPISYLNSGWSIVDAGPALSILQNQPEHEKEEGEDEFFQGE